MSARRALAELWAVIWPDYGELDEEFRTELRDRGVLGLRIVSALGIVMPLLVVFLFWPIEGQGHAADAAILGPGIEEALAGLAIGLAGWLASLTEWGRRRSLALAVAAGTLLGLVATADMIGSGGHASSVYTLLVIAVLLAVAALPLRPLSMLGYGLVFVGLFAASAPFDATAGWPLSVSWLERLFLLLTVAVLGAVLSAVMWRLHVKEHASRKVLAESLAALQRTQGSVIASSRAASQGRLAAAISHEINNPLSVLQASSALIEGHLKDLACKCDDPGAVERSVEHAIRAAARSREALRRIAELVDRFERFTQLDAAERRPVDVNALLDDVVGVLSGSWGERVRVVKDYGEVPEVMAFPTGLNEVFANVLSNAAAAIEGDGEVRLTTRYGRGYVWVQIADTGRGIDMEDMSVLFDPTFRVENGHVRTGWGLFIARQIVHDHNGDFRITSELDRGTEVEICLPASTGTGGE